MTGADVLLPAGLALAGIVAGLAWRIPALQRLDALAMQRINRAQWPNLVDRCLGLLRIVGTTLFFVAVLVLVALARPPWALGLALAASAAELITVMLKLTIRRERPFAEDAGVVVRLPRLPIDASFPSADAMRAAFLCGLTVVGRAWPTWGACPVILVAVAVGLGRVRSGAHYPLDVWTGLTIGFGAVLAWAGTL